MRSSIGSLSPRGIARRRAGVGQAVILAAGLDCRAYRLAWPADSTVFEVDQPRVLEFKQRVLDQRGAEPSTRRVAIATDLRDGRRLDLDVGIAR